MNAGAAFQSAIGRAQRGLAAAGAPPPVLRAAHVAPRIAYERLSPQGREVRITRGKLAAQFLRGDGLEIGALNLPLKLPPGARARYVDRMSVEDLRREYPEWASWDVVEPDVICDGETLDAIEDASVDFVVANHMLEHTEDPVGAMLAQARVLRPGGTTFWALPDKRHTFDVRRPETPPEHPVADHRDGPEHSRAAHYREWAELVLDAPDPDATARELAAANHNIHFHVWTPDSFGRLLVAAGLPLVIEALQPVRHEFVVVCRRA